MRKIHLILILIIIAILIFVFPKSSPKEENLVVPQANQPEITSPNNFQPPLDRTAERVTKKTFGMFITPQNSPVQPERFQGYHTGVDFEIFPEELNTEVSVRAVCSGELKLKRYVSGYGGVAIQECELNNEPITVVYGHLKLSSITANTGENISTGDIIGILGDAFSNDIDGERKHLHLGVHKGEEIDFQGYVQTEKELDFWIDIRIFIL